MSLLLGMRSNLFALTDWLNRSNYLLRPSERRNAWNTTRNYFFFCDKARGLKRFVSLALALKALSYTESWEGGRYCISNMVEDRGRHGRPICMHACFVWNADPKSTTSPVPIYTFSTTEASVIVSVSLYSFNF